MALEKVSQFSFPWNTDGYGEVTYPLGSEWSFKITPPDNDPTRQDKLRFFDGQNYYDISTETNYTADELVNGRTVTVTVPVELVSAALPYTDRVKPEICCSSYVNGNFAGTRYEYVLFAFPMDWDIKPQCTVRCTDLRGCYDRYGKYLYGVSDISVIATPTAQYGATVKSCTITANGKTQVFENPTGACKLTAGVVQIKDDAGIRVTVIDSRGEKSTFSPSDGVLEYAPPAITKLRAERCNANGTADRTGGYLKVIFSSAVTQLMASLTSDKNTAKYELEYKKQSETSFTSVTLANYSNAYAVKDGTHIFQADSASTYDVFLYVIDNHRTTSLSTVAQTATMRMHLKRGVNGIGFGKTAELDGVLDIGWKTRFHGGILPLRLAKNTDLNTVITPGIYDSDRTCDEYLNCPFTSNFFRLEVSGEMYRSDYHVVNEWTDPDTGLPYRNVFHGKNVVQRIFSVTYENEVHVARRVCVLSGDQNFDRGTWSEWEWENPPMLEGVEYRTTERFNGSPVYVQLVNCGTPPNATTKTVSLPSGVEKVFDFGGWVTYWGVTFPTSRTSMGWECWVAPGSGHIYIYTDSNRTAGGTCYVWLKYYK